VFERDHRGVEFGCCGRTECSDRIEAAERVEMQVGVGGGGRETF
jgi:hypothetical protein